MFPRHGVAFVASCFPLAACGPAPFVPTVPGTAPATETPPPAARPAPPVVSPTVYPAEP
jgi:hypothetical protein